MLRDCPREGPLLVLAVLLLPPLLVAREKDISPPTDYDTPTEMGSREPLLPDGLKVESVAGKESSSLPSSLEPSKPLDSEEPDLPMGLREDGSVVKDDEASQPLASPSPFDLGGFLEGRVGARTQNDPDEKDMSIGETRLQIEFERLWKTAKLKLKTDFLFDPVLDCHDLSMEEGEGWMDLREASFSATPGDSLDLKIGRQILSWGTGDLLFVNDLFPKDWISFFIGRDDEYLKAPSDAVKVSLFNHSANLDVVYSPAFDADRFPTGSRLSYWDDALGRKVGRSAPLQVDQPNGWFNDDELALRLYRNIGTSELAIYGYTGFWKSPAGLEAVSQEATFPGLSAYGTSVRGRIFEGIGHAEVGFYDSRDDRSGADPLVKNSEIRLLMGYEQEVAEDTTAGVQYYVEHMVNHGRYERSLLPGQHVADQNRHVLTVRFQRLLMQQNLKLSLFMYYSPSDSDLYLRPRIHYKIDDHWSAEVGSNVFSGNYDHTTFGQFEENSNVYFATRYGF